MKSKKTNVALSMEVILDSVADGVFTIANHFLTVPNIITPNGGETLVGTIPIQWTASSDSHNHIITYSVYYSADGGGNWILLVSALTVTNYAWDTTEVENGVIYLIKVLKPFFSRGVHCFNKRQCLVS